MQIDEDESFHMISPAGVQVFIGASRAEPGVNNVAIFAPNDYQIQDTIDDLGSEFANTCFTIPMKIYSTSQWVAAGRVW